MSILSSLKFIICALVSGSQFASYYFRARMLSPSFCTSVKILFHWLINTSYATLWSAISLNIPLVTIIFSETHEPSGDCVYWENTSDKWDIPWYCTREGCITISDHAIENTMANTMWQTRGARWEGWVKYRGIYNGFAVFWLAVFSIMGCYKVMYVIWPTWPS